MDVQNFDTDGNGVADQTSFDVNGDGRPDGWRIDKTGDGISDEAAMDTDGDNRADLWALDNNQNGVADGLGFDQDLDGLPETYVMDRNENGVPDERENQGVYFPPSATATDPMGPVIDDITESIVTGPMISGNDVMPGVYDAPPSGI